MKNLFALLILTSFFIVSCSSDNAEQKSKKPKELNEFRYNLDIRVGAFKNQVIDKSDYEYAEEVLRKRFDKAGIDEFTIQSDPENNKILVGLDQIGSKAWINRLINSQAQVGFYEGYDEMMDVMLPFIDKVVNPYVWQYHKELIGDDTLLVDTSLVYAELYQKYFPLQPGMNSEGVLQRSVLFRYSRADYHLILNALVDSLFFKKMREEFHDLKLAFDMERQIEGKGDLNCYALKIPFDEEELITDKNIESVKSTIDPNTGGNIIELSLDAKGTEKFRELTSERIGKIIFIVLGDEVVMSPIVQHPIQDGKIQISGNFSVEQAKDLEMLLGLGSFPFKVLLSDIKETE